MEYEEPENIISNVADLKSYVVNIHIKLIGIFTVKLKYILNI